MTKFNEHLTRCVGFIASRDDDGKHVYRGSVFFINMADANDDFSPFEDVFWVTARHVVENMYRHGHSIVHVRVNRKDGAAFWIETPIERWFVDRDDTTCDVAVLNHPFTDRADIVTVNPASILTEERQLRFKFGPSDDVVIVGLFTPHTGSTRNIPIVRSGNIASMDHAESVRTRLGLAPAFLIEARSIGGLSGAPVFVQTDYQRARVALEGERSTYLIGLIHGHYDINDAIVDDADQSKGSQSQINMGIAIVTPISSVLRVISKCKSDAERPRDRIHWDADIIAATQVPDGYDQSLPLESFDEVVLRLSNL